MPLDPLFVTGIRSLYGDVVSATRFRQWLVEDDGYSAVFDQSVVGEIFWRKELGRPNTEKLRDAFLISAQTWTREPKPFSPEGEVCGPWIVPHNPSWWDGKDDDDFWRVAYHIPSIPNGYRIDRRCGNYQAYTSIEPGLAGGIGWSVPDGLFSLAAYGQQSFAPHRAIFVKSDGIKHISFELINDAVTEFDSSGVAQP